MNPKEVENTEKLRDKIYNIHVRLTNCAQLHQNKDAQWIDGVCTTPLLATTEILQLLQDAQREARIDGRRIQAEATLDKWLSLPKVSLDFGLFLHAQVEAHKYEAGQHPKDDKQEGGE